MAQGLQVFDIQGNPTLDTSDRVMKILSGLSCFSNSKLIDVDYNAGLDEGTFFWFMAGGSGTDYERVSVVRFASITGAWIETLDSRSKSTDLIFASITGAWIETWCDVQ